MFLLKYANRNITSSTYSFLYYVSSMQLVNKTTLATFNQAFNNKVVNSGCLNIVVSAILGNISLVSHILLLFHSP